MKKKLEKNINQKKRRKKQYSYVQLEKLRKKTKFVNVNMKKS